MSLTFSQTEGESSRIKVPRRIPTFSTECLQGNSVSTPGNGSEFNSNKAVTKAININETKQTIPENTTEKTQNKGKKRTRNVDAWKHNVRKQLTLSGQSYISKKGKLVPAKVIGEACSNCLYKCTDKITEEQRQKLHSMYWDPLRNWDLKRQFIVALVTEHQIKRTAKATTKNRARSLRYSFKIDEEKIRVCKKFFCNTLSISESVVFTALKKKILDGSVVSQDGRGRKEPPNKVSEIVRNSVREHIRSLLVYTTPFGREKCGRKGPELTLEKMYSFYVQQSNEKGLSISQIAKEWLYRDIYNFEFNLLG